MLYKEEDIIQISLLTLVEDRKFTFKQVEVEGLPVSSGGLESTDRGEKIEVILT